MLNAECIKRTPSKHCTLKNEAPSHMYTYASVLHHGRADCRIKTREDKVARAYKLFKGEVIRRYQQVDRTLKSKCKWLTCAKMASPPKTCPKWTFAKKTLLPPFKLLALVSFPCFHHVGSWPSQGVKFPRVPNCIH